MIKAVIFDGGGVLTLRDSDNYIFGKIAKAFGITPGKVHTTFTEFESLLQTGKMTAQQFWKRFANSLNRTLPRNYRRLWREGYLEHSAKNPAVIGLARQLKKRGYIIALLSNTIKPHAKLNRKRKLFAGFSPVVLSCEVGMRKPDTKIFRYIAGKMKLKPSECVMIDDRPEYLVGAKKIGMHTILFKSAAQLKKELKKKGL